MPLEIRTYSALIVSAAESFNNAIPALFPKARFETIKLACDVSSAKRTLAERSFDFVVVNSPLPDDMGVRFAIDSVASPGTVAVIFARAEAHPEIYAKVSPHGVFTLQKPVSASSMQNALRWMIAARERLRRLEKKTTSIEEKMEEIRSVNRAKWILIRELKMTEPEAHRYIEKQAMDRCVAKGVVASEVIRTYS